MTEPKRLPTRLTSEPIAAAICEVRFDSEAQAAVSLLPGLLVQFLSDFDKWEKLGISEVPEVVVGAELYRYQPHVKASFQNHTIAIGPGMLSITREPPYEGWSTFREFCLEVQSVLRDRKFIHRITRASLRYIDAIALETGEPGLEWLNASLRIGRNGQHKNFKIRTEHEAQGFRVVTQLAAPAQVLRFPVGLIVDIDTIADLTTDNFWETHRETFDALHQLNKEEFFGTLTAETLKALGPEY